MMMLELLDIHFQKYNVNTDLKYFTNIKSKCIRDLNIKHKAIKCLEDNMKEELDNLGYGNNFLTTTLKA